jgi:hypothetical protein
MHRTLLVLVSVLAVALLAPSAMCQDAPPPEPTKITLYPAAPPRAGRAYDLVPQFFDRMPGNAAVFYGKVKAEQTQFFANRELTAKIEHWCTAPLDELREDNASVQLPNYYLREAALCDTCDWQLPMRREKQFYAILLSEAQELRQFARILSAQARIDIAHGRYDEALQRCQYTYALARHAAAGETLVNGLIGLAACNLANAQLRELLQQPDAPNLYWSLAVMPRTMVDFHDSLEADMRAVLMAIPELRRLDEPERTADQWQATLTELCRFQSESGNLVDQPDWSQSVEPMLEKYLQDLPAAKQSLFECGWIEEEVQGMTDEQIVLLDVMTQFRQITQRAAAAFPLPYAEAMRGLSEAQSRADALQAARRIVPLAQPFVKSLAAVRTAQAKMERELAVLMTLEALRLHAAEHGVLPDRLADVAVRIPDDPVTGRPFRYLRDGDKAQLGGPELPNAPLDYEITLKRKGD